jgi:hypothetical protein
MSDYLYVRTQGYFQSLTTLITRGCALAILDGREALTIDVGAGHHRRGRRVRPRVHAREAAGRQAEAVPRCQSARR